MFDPQFDPFNEMENLRNTQNQLISIIKKQHETINNLTAHVIRLGMAVQHINDRQEILRKEVEKLAVK